MGETTNRKSYMFVVQEASGIFPINSTLSRALLHKLDIQNWHENMSDMQNFPEKYKGSATLCEKFFLLCIPLLWKI